MSINQKIINFTVNYLKTFFLRYKYRSVFFEFLQNVYKFVVQIIVRQS